MNYCSNRLIKPEKRLYFIVIYLLFYDGRWRSFCREMGITGPMYEAWLGEKQFEAEEIIKSMKERLKQEVKKELGVESSQEAQDKIPTVESIKNDILTRLKERVTVETDSAKLAAALKVLQKFEEETAEKKKASKKSIYDELKEGGL